jgi:hypothetical protein
MWYSSVGVQLEGMISNRPLLYLSKSYCLMLSLFIFLNYPIKHGGLTESSFSLPIKTREVGEL